MSRPHQIAVLLPPKGGSFLWACWIVRPLKDIDEPEENLSISYMMMRWTDWTGTLLEARGYTTAEQMRGHEWDEIVITHPDVTNDLIAYARAFFRR